MTAENKNALIIFSRLPIGHETKTRLSSLLNENQRRELHIAMWSDIFTEAQKLHDTDIFLYWTGSGDIHDFAEHIPLSFRLCRQNGETLGIRMRNAVSEIFSHGYERVMLTGSDIPSMRAENIIHASEMMNHYDVVFCPSGDGGYWFIGMKRFIPEAFDVSSWGHSDVLCAALSNLKAHDITFGLSDELEDIDTPSDIEEFMRESSNRDTRTYSYLMSVNIYLQASAEKDNAVKNCFHHNVHRRDDNILHV